ncbi:MAG: hypothetical protein JWN02_1335 [Acidobacteria bacterium]|nr:hypothetical protein [Acidobacteriota bacterium]
MRTLRLLMAGTLALLGSRARAAAAPVVVDRAHGEVRFTATVQPSAMARPFGVQGHHAIVWRGGRATLWALFVADSSDHDVRIALDSLGAKRGENLTPDCWNARDDPHNPEPDKRVEGTPLEVFVEWPGSKGRIALSQLLEEKGHPLPLLDFRYGGNERFQKDFHSGCIVCLYSCPGGAVGNHLHPIRDYVRDGVVYSAIQSKLPKAGTQVTITLKTK